MRPPFQQRHVQVATRPPLALRDVLQPCCHEHESGVPVGEGADHAGTPTDLAVQALDGLLVLILRQCSRRGPGVRRRLGAAADGGPCRLLQLEPLELRGNLERLCLGGLARLRGVDGPRHGRDLRPPGLGDLGQHVAVEVDRSALVGGLREHLYRNVLAKVPKTRRAKVAAMLKAIHAMESREASERKAAEVADELESMRLEGAAKAVRDGCAETLTYARFPAAHWRRIRTNNAIERLNRGIRRRTRAVGTFPDGGSALMLVTAKLKYVAESEWGGGSRRYLDVTLLDE